MAWLASAASAESKTTDAAFTAWREDFIARAVSQNRSEPALRALFEDVSPDPAVLALESKRSDFGQPLWAYFDSSLAPSRIAAGRALKTKNERLLGKIYSRYGVAPSALLAIWSLETRFGAASLDFDARRAVATLAFAGRRKRMFEAQLLALVDIIARDLAPADKMRSSWDGGLGQPQFMPDSFLAYAVDGDDDGKRDIWNDEADTLASIANYLNQHGWQKDQPVIVEARVSARLDPALTRQRRTLAGWRAIGVESLDPDTRIGADPTAKLIRPAGPSGPAFLAFDNFDVLVRYNGTSLYGVSAALLARAIDGAPTLTRPWPRQTDTMTGDELIEAQTLLARLSYDAGPADGLFGERTWRALNAFADDNGLARAPYPKREILDTLRERAGEASEPASAMNAPSVGLAIK